MMTREQAGCGELLEGILDHGVCSLDGQTLSPVRASQMKAELVNAWLGRIRSQPAAADMRSIDQQERRPVLNAVGRLVCKKYPAVNCLSTAF